MTISISPFFSPSRVSAASAAGTRRESRPHPHRPALEALGEGRVVLARQQGGRADHRHLPPAHGHRRRRRAAPPRSCRSRRRRRSAGPSACRTPGRPARRRWRSAGRRSPRRGSGRRTRRTGRAADRPPRRASSGAGGGDGDQALGHLAQPLLGAGLARLPGRAAQPVELHALAVGAVAGQEVDVLDRQVELGARRRSGAPGSRAAPPAPPASSGRRSGRCRGRCGRRGRRASARRPRPGSSAARRRRRGRASRSPRMSVSEMTARLSVSKPASSGSTTRCGCFGSAALAACQ